MKGFERKNVILNKLYVDRKVNVKELANEFEVSEETVRRDLEKLEKEGVAQRSYGGAMLNSADDLPYTTRHTRNLDKKKVIATRLERYIVSGMSVMADSSSTVHEALKYLTNTTKDLNVITNSVSALNELSSSNLNIISTGGILRERSSALVGPLTINSVQQFNADITLISCKSLSMQKGLSDADDIEAAIKLEMVKQSNKVILLVDSTKFDQDSLVKLLDFKKVNVLITDEIPLRKWTEFLKAKNVLLQ
ncbi:DeoR family transcriptional regulator [Salipaludibacillus neizhouensis]|uniref:DeoR family transcriptional regulator n=1 Tax=Salipaludibacillus neizhouensis TaxID=885475 RepID=A0A3A9K6H7_9BACI|nr:DeoR/GlpR family DNA-binding transcription regulator [Salipaludibacillus neizhouensis]RKL67849.1 DeoR family transcriptional regulator [Salipaludibacillus neizhouensis]